MGTSASSKGPGGGVPMVPPWVPDAPPQSGGDGGVSPSDAGAPAPPAASDGQPAPATSPVGAAPASGTPNAPPASGGAAPAPVPPKPSPQAQPSPTAPARRFQSARINFGKFASGGDRRHMRNGLRAYVRKGYGGRATAVRRFGGTASKASALHGALSSVANGQSAGAGGVFDPAILAGRPAREIMDAAVEAVCPADGTQDAEASRAAIKDALSELLTLYPDANLLNLSEEQRDVAVERFVALDVFRRAELDIGKEIQDKAPTATVGLARLKEVRDYVKQTVGAAFRKLQTAGTPLTKGRVSQVVRAALDETFKVFEGYVG